MHKNYTYCDTLTSGLEVKFSKPYLFNLLSLSLNFPSSHYLSSNSPSSFSLHYTIIRFVTVLVFLILFCSVIHCSIYNVLVFYNFFFTSFCHIIFETHQMQLIS